MVLNRSSTKQSRKGSVNPTLHKLQSKETKGMLSHAFEEIDVTLKLTMNSDHKTKGYIAVTDDER